MKTMLALAVLALTSARPVATVASAKDVEVIGVDYAFQIPSTLPPGRTTFHLRNNGKTRHEFNILLLKDGVNPDQFFQAVKANQPQMIMIDGPLGVLFADPGTVDTFGLTTNLAAGRTYVVICIERDSANAPRHVDMGMYATFRVTGTSASVALRPTGTDTIVGVNYAFKYRDAVAPGRHTFVFRNDGTVRHEAFIGLLRQGVSLDSLEKLDRAGWSAAGLTKSSEGVLFSRAGETSLGTLEMDMLAGREYVLFCSFQDDAKSPPHYKLGMVGSIHVSGG